MQRDVKGRRTKERELEGDRRGGDFKGDLRDLASEGGEGASGRELVMGIQGDGSEGRVVRGW